MPAPPSCSSTITEVLTEYELRRCPQRAKKGKGDGVAHAPSFAFKPDDPPVRAAEAYTPGEVYSVSKIAGSGGASGTLEADRK